MWLHQDDSPVPAALCEGGGLGAKRSSSILSLPLGRSQVSGVETQACSTAPGMALQTGLYRDLSADRVSLGIRLLWVCLQSQLGHPLAGQPCLDGLTSLRDLSAKWGSGHLTRWPPLPGSQFYMLSLNLNLDLIRGLGIFIKRSQM